MAGRPIKEGFDYFPLDTGFFKDRLVRRLVKKFGSDGLAVLMYLWCECYGDKGYYLVLDEFLPEDMADDLMLDEGKVREILKYLMDHKWFVERKSSDGEEVITSTGVQKRYLSIRSQIRRKYTDPDPQIWLLKDVQNDITSEEKRISSEEIGITSEEKRISSEFLRISSDEQKGTEQNRREVDGNEQKGTETESKSEPVFSDSFQSSFSDSVIDRLRSSGVDVKRNTLQLIDEMIRKYDQRSIDEAVDMAIAGHRTGEVKSVVGYMNTVLNNWANGKGCPKWLERDEAEMQAIKEERMGPRALSGFYQAKRF